MANTSTSLNPLEIDTLDELTRSLAYAEGMVDNGSEIRSLCAEASAFMGPEGRKILEEVAQEACNKQAENQKNAGL